MALFASEHKTAMAEAAAIEAQVWLIGKELAMILLFHFMQHRVLSCRVSLSPILGIKEQLNVVQAEAMGLHRVNDDLVW
jgi:hypothetical protein